MNITSMKKTGRVAAVTLLAASAIVATGVTGAQAASKDGVINTGEFVQWYSVGYSGACEDDYSSDPSFSNDYLKNCGQGSSGVGQTVSNNTESDYNYDYSYTARVYTGNYWTGSSGDVRPRTGGNYNSTFKNNVESLNWHLQPAQTPAAPEADLQNSPHSKRGTRARPAMIEASPDGPSRRASDRVQGDALNGHTQKPLRVMVGDDDWLASIVWRVGSVASPA